MPSEGCQLIHCYNRGCGQKYDPNENTEGRYEIEKLCFNLYCMLWNILEF